MSKDSQPSNQLILTRENSVAVAEANLYCMIPIQKGPDWQNFPLWLIEAAPELS